MSDFDFGLGDMLDQGQGGRTAAGWVAGGLGVIFFLLSSLTTGAFFYRFAPGLGFFFGDTAGPYVAAAIGITCLDAAALAWGYVRAKGCTSRQQQTLTAIVGGADLVGALLVSGLYVILAGSALDVGVTGAAGGLTDFGRGLHLLGTVLITAALVINFGAVWAFSALSADTRSAAKTTQLAAVVREGQYQVEAMRAQQVIGRTLEDIARGMPAAAAAVAEDNRRRYLSHSMRADQVGGATGGAGLDLPAGATVSANGHGPTVNPTGRPGGQP